MPWLLILLPHADRPLLPIQIHMVQLLPLADDFRADPLLYQIFFLGAATAVIPIAARFVLNSERC